MKFKKGDKVIVISGSFKGVSGEILKSYPSQNKLLVKGAGLKTKYVKSSKDYPDGGMFLIERPIDASSVSLSVSVSVSLSVSVSVSVSVS